MSARFFRKNYWQSAVISLFIFVPLSGLGEESGKGIIIGKNIKLFSSILNEERSIIVHLPEGYEKSKASYPVLYILDGDWQTLFSACVSAADYLGESDQIPKMISIGIANTNRNRDMIPAKKRDMPDSGGSDIFLRFINEELTPYINKNYRTEPFRVIFGGSNAGLFVVYVLLESPDSFAVYIAGSPMIGHCPEFMYEKAESYAKKSLTSRKFLYMIYGKGDYPAVTKFVPDFHEFLDKSAPGNHSAELKIIDNEGHVPYTSLYDGLRFVFSEWPLPEDLRLEAGLEEIKNHFNRISEKYGFRSTIPLAYLLDLGIRLSEKGDSITAIAALNYACEIHPNSPDAHYILGTFYEKSKEICFALENYKKALEVNPDYHIAAEKIKTLEKEK